MSQDLMNFEHMTQLALRGVVRDAIRRVIREDGLPGAHHFYITFLTRYPDVEIDENLAKKYPEEITIVLEHQFWDLIANTDSFEVTLKFGGVPKYLKVPYTAVTRFHDPSVGFVLQFDPPKEMEPAAPTLATLAPQPNSASKSSAENSAQKQGGPKARPKTKKKSANTGKAATKKNNLSGDDKSSQSQASDTPNADKVVSLDAFRKK